MNKLILIMPLFLCGCLTTETGEKVGIITKVARSGVICHSYEAQIIRGGLNQGSGAMGASFEFTAEGDDIAKLKEAMESGREVKIKYRKRALTFCASHNDGNYFLESMQ